MKAKLTLFTLLMAYTVSAQQGWTDRTDINPALIYWKEFLLIAENSNHEQVNANQDKPILDQEYGIVVHAYDEHFQRLSKVRKLTAKCEWGNDFAEGPTLLLPHLSPAKRTSQITRLRVRYYLENDQPDQAVEDLLTTFTLARHVGVESILINLLIEIAMNGILLDAIAENFHLFPDEALRDLRNGLKSLPKGGNISATIWTERHFMAGWVEKKILDALKITNGDKTKAIQIIESKIGTFGKADDWENLFMKKSNGSIDDLLKLVQATYPYYQEAIPLFQLPPQESLDAIEVHGRKVKESDNPFVNMLFPALSKARLKELANRVRMAMLEAAIEYRLEGKTGFERVIDPFSESPFKMTRVIYKNKDRGFVLTSEFNDAVYNRQAFVETPGERFMLWGKTIGTPRK